MTTWAMRMRTGPSQTSTQRWATLTLQRSTMTGTLNAWSMTGLSDRAGPCDKTRDVGMLQLNDVIYDTVCVSRQTRWLILELVSLFCWRNFHWYD